MSTAEKILPKTPPGMQLPPLFSMELPEDCQWTPAYYTKPRPGAVSRGYEVALFAKTFLKNIRGRKQGEALEFMEWQTWLANNIFEEDEEGNLRYREVLFMVPRKNGKTFIAAAFLIYHLCTAPMGAEIYSAAASRDQARIVFDLVKEWIFHSPELSALLDVKDSRSIIINKKTHSFYKALAADSGKIHGLAPYFTVLDEIHIWDGESPGSKKRAQELLNAIQKGSIDRAESQILMISTAGDFIDDSLLGSLYKRGMKVAENPDPSGAFGAFIWQAEATDDPLSPETWRKANPQIACGLVTEKSMMENLESSAYVNMATFFRDHLNVWASSSGEPFIQPFIWQNAIYDPGADGYADPFYKGAPVVVGFDASKRGDSTAILVQELESGKGCLKIWEMWERPENAPDGWHISRSDVEESMIRLHEEYEVKAIWADRFYYEAALREWEAEHGWEIEMIPQSKERKDRYAQEFRADLIEGLATHLDDVDLNRHVANTILDRRESFAKPPGSTRQKIDAFVAAVLANAGRNFVENQPEEAPAEFLRFG